MTEIEKKALALADQWEPRFVTPHPPARLAALVEIFTDHLRAIEQHEAFRQEVSEAALVCTTKWSNPVEVNAILSRFIIPKPVDPLEAVLQEAGYAVFPDDLAKVRASLARHGLKITEAGDE